MENMYATAVVRWYHKAKAAKESIDEIEF